LYPPPPPQDPYKKGHLQDGVYQFKCVYDKYMTAIDSPFGAVQWKDLGTDDGGKMTVINMEDSQIMIRSIHDKYLFVEWDGCIHFMRLFGVDRKPFTWTVMKDGSGKGIGLMSCYGKFLRVGERGGTGADSLAIGSEERFIPILVNSATSAPKALSNTNRVPPFHRGY
jgi:hypothetical protein